MFGKFARFIRRNVALRLATAVLGVGLVAGVPALATAPAASASVSYGVSMDSACQQQYPGQGALSAYWNPADAFSWFCFRFGGGSISFDRSGAGMTADITVLGGINVGAWCSRTYPGTFAVYTNRWNVFSWRCWRY